MKGTGGAATCGQLPIWDRMTWVKVLPLWRAPFIRSDLERVQRRDRRDYVEGHAGRATRDTKICSNQAGHRLRVMLPFLCVALYEGTRVGKKTEVTTHPSWHRC